MQSFILSNEQCVCICRSSTLYKIRMIRQKRFMHRLKLRIPIPAELRQQQLDETNAFKILNNKSTNDTLQKQKYTDAEVYAAISNFTKVPNYMVSMGDSKESENDNRGKNLDPDLLRQAQDGRNTLEDRFDRLSEFLNEKPNSRYFPSTFILRKHLVPYVELQKVMKNEHARLSVTKVLPYSFCELKDMYKLYLGGLFTETAAMISGKLIHSMLERKTHPQMEVKLLRKNDDEDVRVISIDKQNNLFDNDRKEPEPLSNVKRASSLLRGVLDVGDQYVDLSKLNTTEKKQEYLKANFGSVDTDNVANTNIHELKKVEKLNESNNDETVDTGAVMDNANNMSSDNTHQIVETDVNKSYKEKPVDAINTSLNEEDKSILQHAETITLPVDQDITTITLEGSDVINSLPHKISQTIRRLINIFEFGKGREILVHGIFNKTTETLVTELPSSGTFDDANLDNYIIISGIVDDLHLEDKEVGAFDEFQKDLKSALKISYDFDDTFNAIKNTMMPWTDADDPMLYIVTNDDKSRMGRKSSSLSYQQTQLLQVGMYRKFLGLLARDVNFAYESWRLNMKLRGEKIDLPMSNSTISLTYLNNHYLLKDYLKLKNGDGLYFEGITNQPIDSADTITTPFTFKNTTNDKRLDILEGEWKYPPTFSYILARLAQTQNLLFNFLSNKLEVTYISRSKLELLEVINKTYDEDFVTKQLYIGMELWMGKREPGPTNFDNACKSCDFRHKCEIPQRRAGRL